VRRFYSAVGLTMPGGTRVQSRKKNSSTAYSTNGLEQQLQSMLAQPPESSSVVPGTSATVPHIGQICYRFPSRNCGMPELRCVSFLAVDARKPEDISNHPFKAMATSIPFDGSEYLNRTVPAKAVNEDGPFDVYAQSNVKAELQRLPDWKTDVFDVALVVSQSDSSGRDQPL
jgi:hypothetical protein